MKELHVTCKTVPTVNLIISIEIHICLKWVTKLLGHFTLESKVGCFSILILDLMFGLQKYICTHNLSNNILLSNYSTYKCGPTLDLLTMRV